MAGVDDNAAIVGDWPPLTPSPWTFFSLLSDDFGFKPFLDHPQENVSQESLHGSEKQKVSTEPSDEVSYTLLSESSMFTGQKSCSQRGLAERMAARAGFNAPKLNTARIRSANFLSSASSEVRSPYLTIPSGLSPTTLLESPVFLSNSLVQQSPTTGKIPFSHSNSRSSILVSEVSDNNSLQDVDTASFVFKPHMESNASNYTSASKKLALPRMEISAQPDRPTQSQSIEVAEDHSQNQQEYHHLAEFSETSVAKDTVSNIKLELGVSNDVIGNTYNSSPPDDHDDGEGEKIGEQPSPLAANAASDDGYNWRKYGQKQVKGSEFPRSYYKCTHPNCQVKKKVERSHEGHVTEIIYKGAHNHPKPPPNRRSPAGSAHPLGDVDIAEQPDTHTGISGEQAWAGTQQGSATGGPDWRHDIMETASSASVATEYDPLTSMPIQNGLLFDSSDHIDISSTMSNDNDEDDQGTHGSISLGYDEDGDESESKRRKLDASVMEISGATRAIREPRVVVQTTSEVDILDDGYRWRKYGQKVVKGNPNPRSYYKCTNPGCTVRKHVERASHDLKSVITTYEGKHNHDVPAARNSSHINSGTSAAATTAAGQIPRPEASSQVNGGITRFDGPASLGTLGLAGRPPMGPMPSFSFGMNQSSMANLAMASLKPGQAKLHNMPIHPYLGQHRLNETGFTVPKGEPKDEPMSATGLPLSTGAIYHQLMSRLPLGHQL